MLTVGSSINNSSINLLGGLPLNCECVVMEKTSRNALEQLVPRNWPLWWLVRSNIYIIDRQLSQICTYIFYRIVGSNDCNIYFYILYTYISTTKPIFHSVIKTSDFIFFCNHHKNRAQLDTTQTSQNIHIKWLIKETEERFCIICTASIF